MKRWKCAWALCAVLVGLSWTAPADAQQDDADLQRALDRPVSFTVTGTPIGEVFERLGKASGVKFIVDAQTIGCLPYGSQTRLDVTLKEITLRNALSQLLSPQALEWRIEGESVRIVPSASLCRMCRRATYEELTLLGKLHTAELKPADQGGAVIDQLRKATGASDLKLFFHVPHTPGDLEKAYKRAEMALPGTAAAWLERLCHSQQWTWYLSGDRVVIIQKKAQLERQLQKQVTLRHQNARLTDVLLDLARKGRFKLAMTPGVMERVSDDARESFTLIMADASIAQALEVISGTTGLEFIRAQDGTVRVSASKALKDKSAVAKPRKKAPYFVRMSLPGPDGTQIEVFMRPEELPKDVLDEIEKAKEKFIAKIRAKKAAEKD